MSELDESAPEVPSRLNDQVQMGYEMLRAGFSEVEVRLAIQETYDKAAKPTQAFRKALELVIQEQRAARENLPELLMAVRWKAIQRALACGEFGAAAGMLRDIGAVCGESPLDAASATLQIEVLAPGEGQSFTSPAGLPQEAASAPDRV
jgi:hypothetical protein